MSTEFLAKTVAAFEKRFSDRIRSKVEFRGETTFLIPAEALVAICKACKEQLGFDYLVDISSLDHYGQEPRFQVVYELCSLETNTHLRLKLDVSEDLLEVETVSHIWPTANWHEREVYDMMGIRFTRHPDLRRILMWDGYPYFPLRKDFPLEGKPSDVPEVAFTGVAPLEGGPFVTIPTEATTQEREPRSRQQV
jgi:NADH-quinone oxidoreductase subunit C